MLCHHVGCCRPTFRTRTMCHLPLPLLFYQLFQYPRFLCGFSPSRCVQVLHCTGFNSTSYVLQYGFVPVGGIDKRTGEDMLMKTFCCLITSIEGLAGCHTVVSIHRGNCCNTTMQKQSF
jgi:hypothetical protein